MVKPGDASMASPFTAKQGNVMPCTDIIKQGRSTLVTTVQMFKILGLLCLSTAYSLSVMYLQVCLPLHTCRIPTAHTSPVFSEGAWWVLEVILTPPVSAEGSRCGFWRRSWGVPSGLGAVWNVSRVQGGGLRVDFGCCLLPVMHLHVNLLSLSSGILSI